MNCEIATIVYSSITPLTKIAELFPLAWEFLRSESKSFASRSTNNFDTRLHSIVGDLIPYHYLGNHRDNESALSLELQELIGDMTSKLLLQTYFSKEIGMPIHFALLCCDGHISTDTELTLDYAFLLQKAAITII